MEAAWLDEGGVSIDMPQMAIRECGMWLTDHPGATTKPARPRLCCRRCAARRHLHFKQSFHHPKLSEIKMKNKQKPITQLSRALRYASHGWRVLPLHTIKDGHCTCNAGRACSRAGKHPLTKHGVRDATTDPDQIRAWWKKWPNANIGIATGPESGIIVIDIDPRNGGHTSLKKPEAELGPLTDALVTETGSGGQHRIFKSPNFAVKTDMAGKVLGAGLDLLSSGSLIVAPASRHISGKRYLCDAKHSDKVAVPKNLPAKWIARLKARNAAKPAQDATNNHGVIGEGNRNRRLTSFAGKLWQTGTSPDLLLAELLAKNEKSCKPPLDRSEVEKIATSIAKYPTGKALDGETDVAEQVLQLVLDQHFLGGQHLIFYGDGQFWCFEGRKWAPFRCELLDQRVLATIQNVPHKLSSTSIVGQVRALAQAKRAVETDLLRFEGAPLPVINCANGELWIADDGAVDLRPHNARSYVRHCLDVAYDPLATCPLYDRTVTEIFAKAVDPEAMVRHWNEFVGYIISQRRNIPLIPILLGGVSNGKTKLMETAARLLGPDLVHHVSIESLEGSRFAIGHLLGKALLLDDDVRSGIKLPDGLLKKTSEAKKLTGEHKFGSTFNFTNRAVTVLLCNGIPSLADLSHGMLRRLMVIPFDRTFTPEEDDLTRFDKIWASELPGVLNRAITGLKGIVQRGHKFDYPESVKRATEEFVRHANPLPAFIAGQCEHDLKARCLMREFYEKYCSWAEEQGITMKQQQATVRRNLGHLGILVKHGKYGDTVYKLRLKSSFRADLGSLARLR